MNTAYKWYSYNNNIIQFYSGDSGKVQRYRINSVEDTAEQSYDYTTKIINSPELNLNE